MIEIIDQMNNTIRLENAPSRIVSLVPSQTELLYTLGAGESVVGITKFCVHPHEWFTTKTRVGGTKNVDIEKVKSLKPDLIIGNKEENTLEDIIELQKIAPVYMSDVNSFDEAMGMIHDIAILLYRIEQGNLLINEITKQFNKLDDFIAGRQFTTLYFMWKDPYFTVGQKTFINDMICKIGGVNLQLNNRYPEWNHDGNLSPEIIMLSSEPFPFKEEHKDFFHLHYPDSKVILVDGEYFSWYGSRLKNAANYFMNLLREIH